LISIGRDGTLSNPSSTLSSSARGTRVLTRADNLSLWVSWSWSWLYVDLQTLSWIDNVDDGWDLLADETVDGWDCWNGRVEMGLLKTELAEMRPAEMGVVEMGPAEMGLLRDGRCWRMGLVDGCGTCWNGTVEMKMGGADGWELLTEGVLMDGRCWNGTAENGRCWGMGPADE